MTISIIAQKAPDQTVTLDFGATISASELDQAFWQIAAATLGLTRASSTASNPQVITLQILGEEPWEDIEDVVAERVSEVVGYCTIHTFDDGGCFTGGIPVLLGTA